MSHRVLVVEPDRASALVAEQVLASSGLRVTVVSSFETAIRELAKSCPDLLLAAVRLGEYNGFHLVLRCHAVYPHLPSVVIGSAEDGMSEADRLGIKYVVKPIDPSALLAVLAELAAARPPQPGQPFRRWPRKPAHLRATVSASPVQVVELSYGGLRLEAMPHPVTEEEPIEVEFPTLGLSVTAVPRWTKEAQEGKSWYCGAEVQPLDFIATRRWRSLVDSLA